MKIYSPLEGKTQYLEEVDDPVFSEKMLGDGVAVKPATEVLYSPVKGKVTMLFPTKHAIGITSDEGVELLLHIGLETVTMNGDGFIAYVEAGDEIKQGDKLISFSLEKIREAECDDMTMIIITNACAYSEIKQTRNESLLVGDELLEII